MVKVETWSAKDTVTSGQVVSLIIVQSKGVSMALRWVLSQAGWRPSPQHRVYRLLADRQSLVSLESRVRRWSSFVSSPPRSVVGAVQWGDAMGLVDREAVA
jgi:hypothetical protein